MKRLIILIILLVLLTGCKSGREWRNEAVDALDPNLCVKAAKAATGILNPNMHAREVTRIGCFYAVINAYGDIAVCHKLRDPNLKAECITENVQSRNDIRHCAAIFDEKLEPDFLIGKSDCFKKIAIIENDITICNQLVDEKQRATCLRRAGAKIAFATNDSSICEKIDEGVDGEIYFDNPTARDVCLRDMGILNDDVNLCMKIDRSPSKKAYCIRNIAKNTDDDKLCELIEDENRRTNCFDYLA